MTLFTAEGILDADRRGNLRGIWHPPSSVHEALLRWLKTQGHPSRLEPWPHQGLITDRRLHVRRAPGLTCLAALKDATAIGDPARNDSKGCGTIMRVAPVALMLPRDLVRQTAIDCSALTHGHPTGQLAAAAWAELLRAVAEGDNLEAAARNIAEDYIALPNGGETADAITRALVAPRDGLPETVESLGGGWVAEEALSIALYACLVGRDVTHALQIAVTHGGDSDSTGAIAGNMLGVIWPDQVRRHPWANVVECSDSTEGIVTAFAAVRDEGR